MIYVDNAATTMVDNDVLNAMIPYLSNEFGNPSTLYSVGWNAHKATEDSRQKFAKAFNCDSSQIFFTSCGSEGDTWIIRGVLDKYYGEKKHIITSKIEHHAVLHTCELVEKFGHKITYIDVDCNGTVDLNYIKNSITDDTVLISIMYVNNEVGTIQPIKDIVEIAHKNNVLVHTDAVQAVGHLEIDVKELGVDFLTVSGHKFYAPKGIGICYIRDYSLISPLICGGKQERGIRGGTENVPYIVGAGYAINKVCKNLQNEKNIAHQLMDKLINEMYNNISGFKINSPKHNRIESTINISFDGVDGEIMQLELANLGICVSTGSACNSGNKNPSHVLTAMGIDKERALNSIRISFGRLNTEDEVYEIVRAIKSICEKVRK